MSSTSNLESVAVAATTATDAKSKPENEKRKTTKSKWELLYIITNAKLNCKFGVRPGMRSHSQLKSDDNEKHINRKCGYIFCTAKQITYTNEHFWSLLLTLNHFSVFRSECFCPPSSPGSPLRLSAWLAFA